MAKERGLRSSNDAKPWKCRCGTINHPKKRRFADLPSWECRGCKREFRGSFKFCLGEVEVDGDSLIGDVWDQEESPYCVAFAYGKLMEITERVSSVNNGTDPNQVECIDPTELEHKFEKKWPEVPSKDAISKNYAIHKALHMGLILKEEGIAKVSSGEKYKIEDLSTIPRDDFSSIMDCLAQGIAFVGTYLAGKRRSKLKYCQIYKSPWRSRYTEKRAEKKGHAVVLIGGGMKGGRKFFYCVNSWDKEFCPRRNSKGEIIKGGIGKLKASDLTKNVIKISQPEKTDSCRRLEPQDVFDISNRNLILMIASKKQFDSISRREKQKSAKDDENFQCADELLKKFREAEYPQNLEEQYKEYSFEGMKENHMYNEKLRCTKVAKTDGTIHSVHGVAQPATSGADAYILANQGSNQPENPVTVAQVTCSESGTGRTVSSRIVAADGGVEGLQSGRPLYQTHHHHHHQQQQQLNQSPSLSWEMMNKAEEASKSFCQEKMSGKRPEEEELVLCDDYEDLQKSQEQARKLSLRKQEEAAGSGLQSVAELATANKGQGDADAAEGDTQQNKVVITEMAEFVWRLQLNEETHKSETEDVFLDEDNDDIPSGTIVKDDTSGLGVIEVEPFIEDPKKDAEEEEVIPDEVVHEAVVGKGLAGALKFLQERGTLSKGINWAGRTTDKKKSKLVGIEDGPKEIRIERMDEFGGGMTPNESFWDLTHKFHGKGPGEMKLEKWQKKYQDDLKTKKMKSSDTPLMSEKMREAQARGQIPYLVLSGHTKSGDDNRGGNGTAEELQAGSANSLSSKNVSS